MNRRCALIGVEGNHDQAFVEKILHKFLGFSKFNDDRTKPTKLADIDYSTSLFAFGIIADADKDTPAQVAKKYYAGFQEYFPDFPSEVSEAGTVIQSPPKLGLYILPNNSDKGVVDTLLCNCGEVAYPEYMQRAKAYIDQFSQEEIRRMSWKPFDKEKATVATVVSVLKPGKTNTVSVADNEWISSQTEQQIPELKNLISFLRKLFLNPL